MINQIMSLDNNFQSVKNSLRERSLPVQIGWNLSAKKIDNFFERHDTRGYKFDIKSSGNIFIVDMETPEHNFVVERLKDYFKVPNGGVVDDPPIDVGGAVAHYKPRGGGVPSAPDIAIYPGLNVIPKPPVPPPPQRRRVLPMLRQRRTAPRTSRHLEIPPVDKSGRPHARIMCEIAVSQKYKNWNKKCSQWMRQEYVRCVFGVKIYDKEATQNANRQFDRCMIARLWTHQATPIPGTHIAVPGQRGVYYEEWNLGTLNYYTGVATACIGPGLANYQVNIPVQNVFWNPPIVGRAPSTNGYAVTTPAEVTANNFVIDLYQLQQVVLRNQNN